MHSKKDVACRLLLLSVLVARKIQLYICPDRKLWFLREVAKQARYVLTIDLLHLSVFRVMVYKTKSGFTVLLILRHEETPG